MHLLHKLCASLALLIVLGGVSRGAEVTLINELDASADLLSNSVSNPTDLGTLIEGDSLIIGSIDNIGGEDADVFTFEVPVGLQLDQILLTIEDEGHYFGMGAGQTISNVPGDGLRLISRLVGASDDGENLLTQVPATNFNSGVDTTSPMPSGDYTIWVQETAFDVFVPYTLTLQTSPSAIPEPSSLAFLGVVSMGVMLRRRRSR